jgi:hypothetical protein
MFKSDSHDSASIKDPLQAYTAAVRVTLAGTVIALVRGLNYDVNGEGMAVSNLDTMGASLVEQNSITELRHARMPEIRENSLLWCFLYLLICSI